MIGFPRWRKIFWENVQKFGGSKMVNTNAPTIMIGERGADLILGGTPEATIKKPKSKTTMPLEVTS